MWQKTEQGVRQISMFINASCYAIITGEKRWSVSDFTGEMDISGETNHEESAQIITENAIIAFVLNKLLSFSSKERIVAILDTIKKDN